MEDCAKAAKSKDARDKYFLAYVGQFDSGHETALRSELPSLQARQIRVLIALCARSAATPPYAGNLRVLHTPLSGMQAAEASLAATVSELTSVLPKLASCGRAGGLIGKRADAAMAGTFMC